MNVWSDSGTVNVSNKEFDDCERRILLSENVALKENFQVVSVKSLQSGGQFSHTYWCWMGTGGVEHWDPQLSVITPASLIYLHLFFI